VPVVGSGTAGPSLLVSPRPVPIVATPAMGSVGFWLTLLRGSEEALSTRPGFSDARGLRPGGPPSPVVGSGTTGPSLLAAPLAAKAAAAHGAPWPAPDLVAPSGTLSAPRGLLFCCRAGEAVKVRVLPASLDLVVQGVHHHALDVAPFTGAAATQKLEATEASEPAELSPQLMAGGEHVGADRLQVHRGRRRQGGRKPGNVIAKLGLAGLLSEGAPPGC
jgi:hypothetical protein